MLLKVVIVSLLALQVEANSLASFFDDCPEKQCYCPEPLREASAYQVCQLQIDDGSAPRRYCQEAAKQCSYDRAKFFNETVKVLKNEPIAGSKIFPTFASCCVENGFLWQPDSRVCFEGSVPLCYDERRGFSCKEATTDCPNGFKTLARFDRLESCCQNQIAQNFNPLLDSECFMLTYPIRLSYPNQPYGYVEIFLDGRWATFCSLPSYYPEFLRILCRTLNLPANDPFTFSNTSLPAEFPEEQLNEPNYPSMYIYFYSSGFETIINQYITYYGDFGDCDPDALWCR